MKNQRIILLLTINIFVLGTLYVYELVKKKQFAPPVLMVLDERSVKRKISVDSIAVDNVWDNYPYLTLVTLGDQLPSKAFLYDLSDSEINADKLLVPGRVILKLNSINEQSNVLIDETLKASRALHTDPVILVNSKNAQHELIRKLAPFVYFTDQKFTLRPDRYLLNYFFTVTTNFKVANLFFPKNEVPQLIPLYFQTVVHK